MCQYVAYAAAGEDADDAGQDEAVVDDEFADMRRACLLYTSRCV